MSSPSEIIRELGPENFANSQSAAALVDDVDFALAMLGVGLPSETQNALENDIPGRTNGWAESGGPDEDGWITTYEGQAEVYPLITEAIELLESLM